MLVRARDDRVQSDRGDVRLRWDVPMPATRD